MEARRAPRVANPIGTVTRTKGAREKARARAKLKSESRYCHDCGEQGHIGVNCPYKWANSIDEEDDQTSSWKSELKNSPAWRQMMKKESGAGLRRAESPDGEGELTHDRQFTTSLRKAKMNRYGGD